MKRVTINAWKKGLVFKNDNLVRILVEGSYWLKSSEKVFLHDMSLPFISSVNFNVLLKNQEFVDATIIVDVQSNEMALVFENGFYASILIPGRHIFWKGLVDYTFTRINLNQIEIDENIDKSLLNKKEIAPFVRSYTVEPFENAVMYVDGVFNKVLGPGNYNFWKNTTSISLSKADLRTMQMEIAGQEILTKDKAALRVNFNVQYQIKDLVNALINNKDFDKQLYVLVQLALREFIGSFTLDELLEKKESVSTFVLAALETKATSLGLSINGCGIKDIILPGEMKDIMNQVLVAEKKAQANTIMRREETASTRSLLNTAKLMEDNTMLFKLKEMEYVERIAEKINSISLSGGSQVADQLKQLFSTTK
jgi:hypothetical protein